MMTIIISVTHYERDKIHRQALIIIIIYSSQLKRVSQHRWCPSACVQYPRPNTYSSLRRVIQCEASQTLAKTFFYRGMSIINLYFIHLLFIQRVGTQNLRPYQIILTFIWSKLKTVVEDGQLANRIEAVPIIMYVSQICNIILYMSTVSVK